MSKTQDKGTAWVPAQVPLLLLACGLPALSDAANSPWPQDIRPWRMAAGTAAIIVGTLLLALGTARLRRNLTPFPRPREAGRLTTTGIYSLVRHPMYGGIVLLALGTALRAAGWLALPVALLLGVFFDRKAAVEERWLLGRFAGYAAYRRHTAKLIPWVF